MAKHAPMRVRTLGRNVGACNICGQVGRLTEDHTPPKGCIKPTAVEMHHITARVQGGHAKGSVSHNGVKYRTLCAHCNNTLLGGQFDPALIDFTNQITRMLISGFALPQVMQVIGTPQRIMRAVLGHLSAQGVGRYMKGKYTEPLRDYFLDSTLPLPDCINVYYWIYPFRGQILVRDCGLIDIRRRDSVLIWFMKFFPVAFMVTWDEPPGYNFALPNMGTQRALGIDDQAPLSVRLHPIVHEHWPDSPTEFSLIMYGAEAITAHPWARRKRKRER